MPTRKTPSSFRSPRFAALLLTLVIAFPIVIASNQSAKVSRKPAGSTAPSMPLRGGNGLTKRESEADRMAPPFLPEVGNDTSLRLRDMVQVPVTPNEVGFVQSTKTQEAITARGTDSGAILVAGISSDTNGEVGASQRVKIVNEGFQIFNNLTGTSVLGPSDISTIWAGFGGSCETGGAGDAVVLYDEVADRWVISQFASATGGKAVTEECFAVSTTSDATGSYYRYAFHLGTNFIDSPHLSVRPDGYLMGDSVYNESGTKRLGSQFFVFDRTAMLAGAAATFTSSGIDIGVGETYSISADGMRLASAPSIVSAVSTLTINLTYDPDSTFTSAGLTAQNITDMKAANAFAAAQFTNSFKDPINVNIRVTAVPGTGTLGQSNTFVFSQPFTTGIRDPTRADATTPDDATMAGAGGSVPSGLADPVGGAHGWWVTRAQRKALSIAADDLTQDGTYTFGGGFAYTYDPNNRAVAGKYDYIGVSMHEFSEIMGRIGGFGAVSIGGSPAYLEMDLFSYTGANTRGLTNGAGRSFSFNNGTTLLKGFNNQSANGGDGQDWASGTNDCFNAFSSSGVKNDLTAVDLQAMDVIGYNFQSTAGSTWTDTDIGVGADNQIRSLWTRTDGSAQLWVVAPNGTFQSNFYGPYSGWTAKSIAAGADNLIRVLWTHTNGTASLWIASNGTFQSNVYGPFAGWTATDIGVGNDNLRRVLWTNTNGSASLWVVQADGSFQGTVYGPYAGWTAKRLTVGSDNKPRVLWTNADGRVSLWVVQPDGTFQGNVYGPFAGWTASDIAVGSDGKTRVLWTNADGRVSLWVVQPDNSFQSNVYGPFAGWTARSIAVGPDNQTRVLWNYVDGRASQWLVAADGTFTSNIYGPY